MLYSNMELNMFYIITFSHSEFNGLYIMQLSEAFMVNDNILTVLCINID